VSLLRGVLSKTRSRNIIGLFDHLVGERQEGFRDRQPKRRGSFKIDDKIKLIRLFYWNIARFAPRRILSTKSAARRN
jgi:hypothetical protein